MLRTKGKYYCLIHSLLYDKNGNLIGNLLNNKRQFEYVYDSQNRLIQVNRYNEVTGKEVLISFQYDGLGRRTSKKVANVLYEYIYSGNDVIEETQSNINPTSGVKVKKESREYTYGARGIDDVVSVRFSTYERIKKLDQIKATGDYYYEKDHEGSIIRITSSTGGIVDEYSYTVFGKAYRKNLNGLYKPVTGTNDSPIGNTRLYTGREYDKEISLYYLRARYYDPQMGRFISRDPIGMRDNVNLYTYVANSPINYVDRMGLEKVLIILGIDKDGIIPQIDEYGNIIGPLDTYIELQYITARKVLKQKGESIAIRIVTNFKEFDNAINERTRESTYFIGHGFEDGIAIDSSKLNSSNSWINSDTLIADLQTKEQRVNLSKTELYILSCNTGEPSLFGDPIAQDIQDHYGFKVTYAPTTEIWSDGRIYQFKDEWSPSWDNLFNTESVPVEGTMAQFY